MLGVSVVWGPFSWAASPLPPQTRTLSTAHCHPPPAAAGVAALGVSVVWGPFSWANQGCWLGYFASVAATVALVSWEIIIWPAADLRRASRASGAGGSGAEVVGLWWGWGEAG